MSSVLVKQMFHKCCHLSHSLVEMHESCGLCMGNKTYELEYDQKNKRKWKERGQGERRALKNNRVMRLKTDAAGMCRWCATRTDLTDASHPGDEQLAKEFILDRHLGEEVVDFVVLTICSVPSFFDHVSEDKTGLWVDAKTTYRQVLVKMCQRIT